jgi:RNA polymerase sigma factor (sigma-70 family)
MFCEKFGHLWQEGVGNMVEDRNHTPRPERQKPYAERVTWDPRDRFTPLLLRAQAGQLECLGEAWLGLTPFLWKKLVCGNFARSQEVNDVLQQAYLTAQKNLASFDYRKGTAAVWFWTITRCRALDALRKAGRTRTLPLEEAATTPSTDADEVERLQGILAEELGRVSPPIRKAFELRFYDERPYAAIARELNVPMGTVAGWIHKLRRRLRERGRELESH